MTEKQSLSLEIKLAIKKKGLQYKLKKSDLKDGSEDFLLFVDATTGTQVRGKIVRSFNEGEVYHWPLLNHENIAPLIEILHIRDDLQLFFTIDHQMTLKNIVHDVDFVYDPRCFNRKRMYAKDIFSGLSYLHAKSLCLMNLSDDNIFISKLFDKAIIADFRHLTYLQQTTRCKLYVPEVYKAPETENAEFDAMPAEMWASGALMLDVFLAHMVPWAVIDFKANRVVEIVEKLSLELLQAANPGSIVSFVDLAKLKTFLKCFFRPKPLTRILAKHAAIASFLTLTFHGSDLRTDIVDEEAYTSEMPSWYMQTGKFTSNNRECYLDVENFTQQIPNPKYTGKTHNDETIPKDYFYSPESRDESTKELHASVRSKWHIVPKSIQISVSANELNEHFKENNSTNPETFIEEEKIEEIDLSRTISSIKTPNSQIGDNFNKESFPFSTSFATTSTIVGCHRLSNSYHEISEKINGAEPTKTCYESKSLSLIKSQTDLNNNTFSIQFKSQSICSSLNMRATSQKHFSLSNLNSNLRLDLLFGNNSTTNIPETTDIETNEESLDVEIVHDSWDTWTRDCFRPTHEYNTAVRTYRNSLDKSSRFPKSADTTLLLNKPDIRLIIGKVIFLKKCQLSLRTHLNVFVSKEFTQKQRMLLNKYQTILHQENLRLCDALWKKYKLSIEDIVRLMRNLNSERSHFSDTRHENMSATRNRYTFFERMLSEKKKLKGPVKGDVSNDEIVYGTSGRKSQRRNVASKRLNRRYSYRRAVEASEKELDEKWKLMGALHERETSKESKARGFITDTTPSNKLTEPANKEGKTPERQQKFEMREIPSVHIKSDVDYYRGNAMNLNSYSNEINNLNNAYRWGKDMSEEMKYMKEDSGKGTMQEVSGRGTKEDDSEKVTKKEKSVKTRRKGRKGEKNVRKFHELKTNEKPKKSFFFSLCPGGRVEEPTSISNTLCEKCKLKFDAV